MQIVYKNVVQIIFNFFKLRGMFIKYSNILN